MTIKMWGGYNPLKDKLQLNILGGVGYDRC